MEFFLIVLAVIAGIIMLVNPFIGLLATIALIPQALIPSLSGSFMGAFSAMTPHQDRWGAHLRWDYYQGCQSREGVRVCPDQGFCRLHVVFDLYFYLRVCSALVLYPRELHHVFFLLGPGLLDTGLGGHP